MATLIYCFVPDVREMIKDDALDILISDEHIEDPAEREARIVPIVEDAIEDAQGEIDGYLAKRYPVPLPAVPKVISKIAKDIAVYNIFSRIGIDEKEREKNYLTRYNAAIAFLKLVTEGKVDLDLGTASDHQTAAATGFAVRSDPRLFSRCSLRGM